MPDEVHLRTTANRRVIARLFTGLDEEQLSTPSLCAWWTCRDVLGHLVMSLDLSFSRFLLEVVRDRGRAGVTSDRLARAYGTWPVHDLVRRLEERSGVALSPPGVGAHGPFADSCIHLRDVAIPLGIPTTPPVRDWVRVLDFLTTPRARAAGLLPRGRLDGLALQASDDAWSSGSGDRVTGTSEALALSLTGRPALLDDLTGAGASTLRRRVLDQQAQLGQQHPRGTQLIVRNVSGRDDWCDRQCHGLLSLAGVLDGPDLRDRVSETARASRRGPSPGLVRG